MCWLIDFVSSAYSDHHPREGRDVDLTTCLTTADAVPVLVDRGLQALRQAAQTGSLLQRPNLMFLLYCWKQFAANDGAEVKTWLAERMQRDDVLVLLAKALTSESWSTGLGAFGTLGDRVVRRQV